MGIFSAVGRLFGGGALVAGAAAGSTPALVAGGAILVSTEAVTAADEMGRSVKNHGVDVTTPGQSKDDANVFSQVARIDIGVTNGQDFKGFDFNNGLNGRGVDTKSTDRGIT